MAGPAAAPGRAVGTTEAPRDAELLATAVTATLRGGDEVEALVERDDAAGPAQASSVSG